MIDQIFFVSDVPRQQVGHEQVGQFVFPMERLHHGLLIDSQNSAIRHCGRRPHAKRLTGQRTFTEELALA